MDDNVDINMAWGSIRDNIRTSFSIINVILFILGITYYLHTKFKVNLSDINLKISQCHHVCIVG
jgi:hypothetical protein